VSRAAWAVAGAVVGVVVVRQVASTLRRATPESVADAGGRFAAAVGSKASAGLTGQVRRLADSVADFAAAVRENAAEREDLLRSALGVDVDTGGTGPDGGPQRVSPEEARRLLEHPTQPHGDRRAG
jgi:hypothetical protein